MDPRTEKRFKKSLQAAQMQLQLLRATELIDPTQSDHGWVEAIRIAMRGSRQNFADRLKVKRQAAADLEQAEADGSASIRRLRRAADDLGCDLVCYFRPRAELQEYLRSTLFSEELCNLARAFALWLAREAQGAREWQAAVEARREQIERQSSALEDQLEKVRELEASTSIKEDNHRYRERIIELESLLARNLRECTVCAEKKLSLERIANHSAAQCAELGKLLESLAFGELDEKPEFHNRLDQMVPKLDLAELLRLLKNLIWR